MEAAAVGGVELVHWPIEVRLCVATFLPWRELVRDSTLCRAWRSLERQDLLWQAYFGITWPRLARRKAARVAALNEPPWRVLFRERWAEANRSEDALEEDWLDFGAAQDLVETRPLPESGVQCAVRRCKEDLLRLYSISVPAIANPSHVCSPGCRFHRVPWAGDVFLCEMGGGVHMCDPGVPCDWAVQSHEDAFLVCPVSGRCFPKTTDAADEVAEAGPTNDWDPDLSAAQQVGVWFEQGYSMSEDQARDFFGNDGQAANRSLSCGA